MMSLSDLHFSGSVNMKSMFFGVPQGLVFSPMLFIIVLEVLSR